MNDKRDIIEPGITEHLKEIQKPVEIKIIIPKYILNLLNKLSELSGVSKERMINNFIISELDALKENPEYFHSFFQNTLIKEIDSCVTNFKDDFVFDLYGK